MIIACSARLARVGGAYKTKNPDDDWREEIRRFMLLWAPLDAGIHQEEEENQELLPSHSLGSEVISIGGLPELLWRWFPGIEKIRERLRENERLGNIRDSLGFPSGHRRDCTAPIKAATCV
jgi:hypothetical protein